MNHTSELKELEFEGKKSNYTLYSELRFSSDEIIFVHPTISLFFDKLTLFRFVHNEIIVPQEKTFDFSGQIIINTIPSSKFEIFKLNGLNFTVKFNETNFNFKCLSPEFGMIWMLQKINSLSIGLALALLEFSDLNKLNKYQNLFSTAKIFNFILELGKINLNRYDLIWQLIKKFHLENNLSDLPLFLDKNIRIERKYGKII